MFHAVMEFFSLHDIDINDCRGQSYDNASSMSGKFNGLQTKINEVNKLALWIPCFAHSLNLVGTSTMECCLESKIFFDNLEKLYVFFTSSTDRFDDLNQALKNAQTNEKERILLPKRVSTTRWSSRREAARSLRRGYDVYKLLLSKMSAGNAEAQGLFKWLSRLETGIYIVLWHDILERVDAVNKSFQNVNTSLCMSYSLLKSLETTISNLRDIFVYYENQGKKLTNCDTYSQQEKRPRKRNVRSEDLDAPHAEEVVSTHSDTFRR